MRSEVKAHRDPDIKKCEHLAKSKSVAEIAESKNVIEKSWSKSRLILKKCYRDQEKLSRSSKVLAKSLKVRSWSKNYLEHKKYTKIIKKLNLDLWKVRRVILKNLKLYLKTWPRLTLAKMLSRSKRALSSKITKPFI